MSKQKTVSKPGFHPRNLHQGHYDLEALTKAYPRLASFLITLPNGQMSIDFAQAQAVLALNKALLTLHHNLPNWHLPEGFLCPPIPGRADYIHHLADLLAAFNSKNVPTGPMVKVLDIGVGANAIYPLLGHKSYGWRFVGAEVNQMALDYAGQNTADFREFIEIRKQKDPQSIFKGIIGEETFDLTMCNPPFHDTAATAAAGSERKFRQLKIAQNQLNFGGQHNELWCEGGEYVFVTNMIRESVAFKSKVLFFSTLVSKSEHLKGIYKNLEKASALTVKTIPMHHGNKISRLVAWTFQNESEIKEWAQRHWQRDKESLKDEKTPLLRTP